MALRRYDGFTRYAFSVQYHGGPFLGFAYQGDEEDAILPDGTDLRGCCSVEGRLRWALQRLLANDGSNYENFQVSSRTDGGVHALKNTAHVDIRNKNKIWTGRTSEEWDPRSLCKAWNSNLLQERRGRRQQPPSESFIRILSVKKPPAWMPNKFAVENDTNQPALVDWNARFSATQRTYVYRILHRLVSANDDDDSDDDNNNNNNENNNHHYDPDHAHNWAVPFEWDRSWQMRTSEPLDIIAMKQASQYMIGTDMDFTSFRAANCQRHSPLVTIQNVDVQSHPYGLQSLLCGGGANSNIIVPPPQPPLALITIRVVGESFLYRQVRNMVGCLVQVGKGKLLPKDIPFLIDAKDRSVVPASTAPAHGLYLVDVQHGNFYI